MATGCARTWTWGGFDVRIGSDLLYEPDHPGQLAEFIELHAEACADVLIIDPNRGHRSAFMRCMRQAGFDLTESKAISSGYRGHVLRYRRSTRADFRQAG